MRYIEEEAKQAHPVVTATGRDSLAWAKRIMYREEKGDKTLMPIQVRFAREALGILSEKTP